MRSWTAWDGRLALRAAAVGGLAAALAVLITAATDEGNVRWVERCSRILPLVPVAAAVGTWMALAPAHGKGEVVALAALGRTPWQVGRAAVLGGGALAAAVALAIAVFPRFEPVGFFPAVVHAPALRFENGAFVEPRSGIVIATDGRPEPPSDAFRSGPPDGGGSRDPTGHLPNGSRPSAALATLAAGIALPLLAARRRAPKVAVVSCVMLAFALAIVLFHAAAAGAISPYCGAAPAMLLLGLAAFEYRSSSWRKLKFRI